MMRLFVLILALMLTAGVKAETATSEQALKKLSEQAQPLPLTVIFEQRKYLSGLPRALVSSGEMTITEEAILWETQKPQKQSLKITEQGIFKGSQQTSATGSETIAELLLAILKQDERVLQELFSLSLQKNCVQMVPNSDTLAGVMQRILSCGNTRVERVELHETNGNRTEINFAEAPQ